MKLTKELKAKIEDYFDNISPEELYNIATTKCGFKDETELEFYSDFFHTTGVKRYDSVDSFDEDGLNNTEVISLAA